MADKRVPLPNHMRFVQILEARHQTNMQSDAEWERFWQERKEARGKGDRVGGSQQCPTPYRG